MATKNNNNVTAGEVVSATVRYTNEDDSTREFNIKADVNITNKEVSSFNSGEVRKLNEEMGMTLATFNASGNTASYFNISFNNATDEEMNKILSAVISFVKDVKENVDSKNAE